MSSHDLGGEVVELFDRFSWVQNADVVAEIEELSHRFDIGVADSDQSPLILGIGDVGHAGSENSLGQVQAG